MLLGSMLAGMAFANAPVAAVHALAYPIGAHFHVPHGLSNALVLMGVMRFNLEHPRRICGAGAARRCEGGGPAAAKGGGSVRRRARRDLPRLRLPDSLAAVGVEEKDLELLATDAMKQTRLLVNNPREVTYSDAFAIYSEALDGKIRRAA